MAKIRIVRTEQKSPKHYVHWLTDGRYVFEDKGRGGGNLGGWSLWQPMENRPKQGKRVRNGSSLGQLLKWAEKNPPR